MNARRTSFAAVMRGLAQPTLGVRLLILSVDLFLAPVAETAAGARRA